MSDEKMKPSTGTRGRYEREDDDQAIRNRDAEWERILKAEQEDAWKKRKRRVMMVLTVIMITASMITLVQYEQMTYTLGMVFNAALATVCGWSAGSR